MITEREERGGVVDSSILGSRGWGPRYQISRGALGCCRAAPRVLSRARGFQNRPRGPQETPKRVQEASKTPRMASIRLKRPQRSPT
eukprot:9482467-Pyramimonas_sp.AAC.1